MPVNSVSTSEIEDDYFNCEECENEGFYIKNSSGKCSCGSREVYKIDAKVYRCEDCNTGVSADRDYIEGRCECD